MEISSVFLYGIKSENTDSIRFPICLFNIVHFSELVVKNGIWKFLTHSDAFVDKFEDCLIQIHLEFGSQHR